MILNIDGGSGRRGKILVTAPAGSTVTCTRGDVTRTAREENGRWTFRALGKGTWTVTGTKDGLSDIRTVTITGSNPVSVTLQYRLYLINGAPVGGITGGWISEGAEIGPEGLGAGYNNPLTVTQNSSYITITQGVKNRSGVYRTVKAMDLTSYSKLVFVGSLKANFAGREWACVLGCYKNSGGYYGQSYGAASLTGERVQGTHALDISHLTGSYYIKFGQAQDSCAIRCDQLYLE